MHGRKRTEYKHRFADPQVAAGLAQKAQQWYALSDKALSLRENDDASMTLPLLDKMLRVNPDPLHLWNIRRSQLLLQSDSNWLSTELALTAAGLERNPKAYGAWFHRKWVLQRQSITTQVSTMESLLQQELALTDLFLQRDERNFHCWNFRRFLVGLELQLYGGTTDQDTTTLGDGSWWMTTTTTEQVIGPQITAASKTTTTIDSNNTTKIHSILQREWDFTQGKIVSNFSNFSAFHYRSKLLLLSSFGDGNGWSPKLASTSTQSVQAMAEQEWSLMENIMFTEPDDQTIWWYHRFLLDFVVTQQQQSAADWYVPWLARQAETLQVLVEEDDSERGCKWGLLGWHLVLSRLVASSEENKEERHQQMETVLDRLIEVDPDRTQRYQIMKKQKQQKPQP
ncbi:transferase type-2 subunit alpha [Seminavis robusta]|uniref:Geranylgeranyl transferase type-2 subunit alpha n=1 Tax=Seminavis robusta TaxID=568900 RepID=A0A9N8DFJ2_9STRA|nr:transferase type-2 subunit alpha [Seminavis robusta]|eukprot:Sro133_g062920.1 transferase type-2 subunit alpha (397) ;mRNA; f:27525-28715